MQERDFELFWKLTMWNPAARGVRFPRSLGTHGNSRIEHVCLPTASEVAFSGQVGSFLGLGSVGTMFVVQSTKDRDLTASTCAAKAALEQHRSELLSRREDLRRRLDEARSEEQEYLAVTHRIRSFRKVMWCVTQQGFTTDFQDAWRRQRLYARGAEDVLGMCGLQRE